jgi:two-component system chemotaxis sensor kinase CheA
VCQLSLDNEQYRALFIEEAKEHVEILTKSLLILEKDPTNTDVLNMLFRSAHTLKGSSGMMGFKDFQELTHAMEDVFDEMRKGKHSSSDLTSTLLECVDALNLRLDMIQSRVEEEIDVRSYVERLRCAAQTVQADKLNKTSPQEKAPGETAETQFDEKEMATMKEAQACGKKCYTIDIKFTNDCAFKSIRANMVLTKLAQLAKIVKTSPSTTDIKEENFESGFKITVTTNSGEQEIQECAKSVCEIEQVGILPVNLSHPDTKEARGTAQTSEEKTLAEARSTQTIRVKFDQLDKLMNWVGELVINKIALLQVTANSSHDELKRISGNIDRLTTDLQDLVMQIRMVPVSQVFDRFPRLIRDLSLKKGKKIDLVMDGREIEVDRTVLDEIGEPLIHLLRNGIDHGIEAPNEREKNNKNPTGKIRLSAKRKGDHIIIEVEDDGAGINPEKVKEAAINKGLITEAEARKLTTEQLINLIYLPGLSTAKEITETSGRGVGMDVVKTKISALGGTVHLETHQGSGTKVTIRLPLTLAIIQAILVRDSGQTYAVPASQVSEIVLVRKGEMKPLGGINAVVVRGQVMPVLHLHELLKLKSCSDDDDLELLVTFIGDEERKLGLAVDSVVRQQDILIKSFNDALSNIKGVSGATILGDGQVVLVLDVAQLINRTSG